VLPPDLLRRWCDDAHRHGAFVIADEIQVGLRRCGPLTLSGHHHLPVDGVLLGKPLGGGVLPLSALVCSEALFQPLIEDPWFHTATFGGHPLSCAAGLAALGEIDACGGAVAALEPRLRAGLDGIARDHPGLITRTGTSGVFGVVGAVSEEAAQFLLTEAARRGLLLAPCLTASDTLRLLPPAVVEPSELDGAFARLDEACTAVTKRVGV
jgi:putrescine aminotransferase